MSALSLCLLETGPFQDLPGFSPSFPFALLPFWGNHCLADFALANAALPGEICIEFMMGGEDKPAALELATRWKRPAPAVHVLEKGIEELAARVAVIKSEYVALSALSSVTVVDPGALLDCMPRGSDIIKLSVQNTPIETYAGRREPMAALLASHARRARRGGRTRDWLFRSVLDPSIDLIQDVPGEILFQNDITEYYGTHIWCISNCEDSRYNRIVSRLPPLAEPARQSQVAEKGLLRNSLVASGVTVEGTVEGSFLFPDVIVRRGATVVDSVVLNGNRLGAGATLQTTLVLPFIGDAPRTSSNIGDNCQVGARGSTAKNGDHPLQIRDGLTVLGMNCDIPSGFKAEAASLVEPGVPASALRKLKVLRRGTSARGDVQ